MVKERINRKDLKGLSLDRWDRQNIENAIRIYEDAHPGEIAQVIIQARKEVKQERVTKAGRKDGITFRVALPLGLSAYLKKGYPTIFSDKGQFEQFLKWFPDFDLLRS